MDYSNSQMKLDQLIGYFNEGKINLIPSFQRGHVWPLAYRQGLLKNIVNIRPIPAIFLYKEAEGSKYSYNILDGKQRLESLLMFIGSKRKDISIKGVQNYFFDKKEKDSIDFSIEFEGEKTTFADLPESVVRDLREYAIPTIEINLNDETSLDEIIDLFIDINQTGVKVNRFDIVKAMQKNPLLNDVFGLLAEKQVRKHDIFYQKKNTVFTRVLNKLQMMQNLQSPNSKVDRMWERLLEIVLFYRTKKHRAPAQILKSFIRIRESDDKTKLSSKEKEQLKGTFGFLANLYQNTEFATSRFATDQTHFYTMITSLHFAGLLEPKNKKPADIQGLKRKLVSFAKMIEGKGSRPVVASSVKEYMARSQKQTTHIGQREDRQRLFLKIIDAL